jgi:ABC-type branched-subunit amino acid transport system ATPase component
MIVMPPVLSARKLAARRSWRTVFQDFDIDIMPGERVLVHGENGCGKTTLLETLLCLHKQSSGEILWNGQHLCKVLDVALLTGRIVFLPQHNNIFSSLSIRENIMLGCRLDAGLLNERLNEALRVVPSLRNVLDLRPEQVSSGQRQLTACFRVLMRRPEILVLDEPTAGLARDLIEPLYKLFENSLADRSFIIFSEQSTSQASAWATRSLPLRPPQDWQR